MPTESPWSEQAITYHAREDRRMLDRLPIQAGVVGAGDLKVTPVSGLTVAVAAGDAWVLGSHAGVTRQGLYNTGLAASENVVVGTANATNPRIDQLVLRIRDTSPAPATAGDAENSGKLEIVAGTATAGATLDNRTGAAALPASCIRLADILVPAAFAGPFVQATHLRDRRQWAHGAYKKIVRTANAAAGSDYTTASTSFGDIDATNLSPRIECSGLPVRVSLRGRVQAGTTGIPVLSLAVDGAGVDSTTDLFVGPPASSTESWFSVEWDFTPAVGSHKLTWRWRNTTAVTATILARVASPLQMIVEEIVTQDASNDGA